jgi:hypothetical protein
LREEREREREVWLEEVERVFPIGLSMINYQQPPTVLPVQRVHHLCGCASYAIIFSSSYEL